MKRFTETEKWRDSWFRQLSPDTKLAYLYILDSADIAGVWDPDKALADFTIGRQIDWERVRNELGDRVKVLDSGKWLLTRFVAFQYGKLSEDCRPHAAVLRLIEAHGIKRHTLFNRVSKGYTKPQGQGQGQGQGQDKDKDTAAIYAAYPRKEAKQAALKAIAAAIELDPSETRAAYLLEKTRAYADATAKWPADARKFIPHPATWFNRGSYDDDPRVWVRSDAKPQETKAETVWELQQRETAIRDRMRDLSEGHKGQRYVGMQPGATTPYEWTPDGLAEYERLRADLAAVKKQLAEAPEQMRRSA
jgi:hypothetical protein